jgi:predicted nucleic acid-binding protein
VNVVDTSGWIEYFTAGPNASHFAPLLADTDSLIVPTINIYEVFKWVLQKHGESEAVMAVALMQQGMVVDLSIHLALEAARTSVTLGIPMAGSIILATARISGATLWTQDADFATVEGVRYVARRVSA